MLDPKGFVIAISILQIYLYKIGCDTTPKNINYEQIKSKKFFLSSTESMKKTILSMISKLLLNLRSKPILHEVLTHFILNWSKTLRN